MSPKDFKRARSADAIEARRNALLEAARELLNEADPSDISLSAISGKAGLVKSAIYRYFESREDVLAEVLLGDLTEFRTKFAQDLAKLERDDFIGVARLFAQMVASRLRMAGLVSQMTSILERNISGDRLLAVKLQMKDLLGAMVGDLSIALPSLGPEKAYAAASMMYMQIAAHYPLANPDENIAKALEHEELAIFKTDFRTEIERACRIILLGVSSSEFEV